MENNVASVKNFGLVGVGNNLQLGKQGPKLLGNADTDIVSVTNEGGSTLTEILAANGTSATALVTKAQLDATGVSDGFSLTLGNIDASGDGEIRLGDSVQVLQDIQKPPRLAVWVKLGREG